MALTLYAHPLSSYCQKALIGLYELDLPFALKFLDPADQHIAAELRRLWPIGKMPVLVDDGAVFVEASLIVEHLDAISGSGRLVPMDAAACMEMRLMDRVFDNYIATPQQKIIADRLRGAAATDPKGVEEAYALLEKTYGWLDGRLNGRAWAAGAAFSLADCGAAQMLFYADWVYPIGSRHEVLGAYLERLRARPAVARVFAQARPYHGLVPGGIPAHVK